MLNLPLNGTEFESPKPIDEDIFTDEALSNVTIDGEPQGQMKLVSIYPFEGGTRFSLRKLTPEELENERLNAELTSTQLALAEVFEMVLGGDL